MKFLAETVRSPETMDYGVILELTRKEWQSLCRLIASMAGVAASDPIPWLPCHVEQAFAVIDKLAQSRAHANAILNAIEGVIEAMKGVA